MFTYDIIVWTQHQRGGYLNAFLEYAPERTREECFSLLISDQTLSGLGEKLRSYLRKNTTSGTPAHEFSLVNLPRTKEEFGGQIWRCYHESHRELFGMKALEQMEFSQLQEQITEEFPDVWGLPSKPYSAIPLITDEEELLREGGLMARLLDAFPKQLKVQLEKAFPPDVKSVIHNYRNRN